MKSPGDVLAALHGHAVEPECATLPVPTYVGRHKVLGPLTGGPYFVVVNTAPGIFECEAAPSRPAMYELGPELPLDEFVSFVTTHDP